MTDEKTSEPPKEEAKPDTQPKVEDKGIQKEEAVSAGKHLADIERAELNAIKDEAKAINEDTKRNLAKIAEFNKAAESSGRGLAVPDRKPETADEKWSREAKERWAGTGHDPT